MPTTGTSFAPTVRVQLAASVLRSVVLFVFQWVLARVYGASVFGVCNTAQAGQQTATMFGRAAGDTVVLRGTNDSIHHGITLSLVGGLIAGLGLVVWGLIADRPSDLPGTWAAYVLAGATVPLAALAFPFGAVLQRGQRFRAYALIITLLDPLVRLLVLGIAVVLGGHWLWSMSSFPLGAAVALVMAVLILRPALTGLRAAISAPGERLSLLAFSGETTVAAALQTAMLFAALTVATLKGGAPEAGQLAAAARIVMLALWIQIAYATPFLPMIPRLVSTPGHVEEARAVYHGVVTTVLWVNAPLLVGMASGAEAVLGMFGSEFRSGAVLLVVLVAGQWVNSASALAEDFLPLSGRSRLALRNNAVALVATAGGASVLHGTLGIFGVAIAYSAATIGLNVMRSYQIHQLFGVSLPYGAVAKAGMASVFALAASSLLPGTPGSFSHGGVCALLTFASLYAIASPSERATLHALVRRR